MATPILNGLMRVTTHYAFSGGAEEATNTYHFRNDPPGPWTQAEVDALDIVNSAWITALNDRRSSLSMVDRISYTDFSAAIPVQFEKAKNAAGTAAGQAMPLECAVVISLRTGAPGRSRRGRIYFPHLTTGQLVITNSLPAVDHLAAVELSTATATLMVGNANCNGGVYSPLLNQFRTATEVIVNEDWDTQRRRGRLNLPETVTTVPPSG